MTDQTKINEDGSIEGLTDLSGCNVTLSLPLESDDAPLRTVFDAVAEFHHRARQSHFFNYEITLHDGRRFLVDWADRTITEVKP